MEGLQPCSEGSVSMTRDDITMTYPLPASVRAWMNNGFLHPVLKVGFSLTGSHTLYYQASLKKYSRERGHL